MNNVVIINISELIELYNNGCSIFELAKRYNTTHATIKNKLIKNNIELRNLSSQQKITMNKKDVKNKISASSINSQQKRKETNLKKYGTEVPALSINWKDEYEIKNGVRHPNQRIEEINKMKGDNNPAKKILVQNKIKQNRWINKSEQELTEIKNKSIETWKIRLNTTNPLKNKKVIEKVKKTNIKKLGVPWTFLNSEIIEKSKNTHRLKMRKKIIERLSKNNLELIDDFINVTNIVKIKCNTCNNIFESVLDYIFHDYGLCPTCNPRNISTPEYEIGEYIKSIIPNINDIIFNDRKILDGKEIDILLLSKNIGIEHDGLYYHSDYQGILKDYHINKTELANKKGIHLIHIFEDEWNFKKDIVKSRLKRILNVDNSKKIFARKCIIKEINNEVKNIFLEKYHIQGKDISSVRIGAFYNDELVAVMTFSKGNISKGSKNIENIWELNRFCSNYNYLVVGIASKLLTYFKRNFIWKEIFSYCDRRWSNGNTYYKLGFVLDKITNPNYWYVKSLNRIHRFNLRKKENEPKNITEWDLRSKEGYKKIWDCGNFKFKMINL